MAYPNNPYLISTLFEKDNTNTKKIPFVYDYKNSNYKKHDNCCNTGLTLGLIEHFDPGSYCDKYRPKCEVEKLDPKDTTNCMAYFNYCQTNFVPQYNKQVIEQHEAETQLQSSQDDNTAQKISELCTNKEAINNCDIQPVDQTQECASYWETCRPGEIPVWKAGPTYEEREQAEDAKDKTLDKALKTDLYDKDPISCHSGQHYDDCEKKVNVPYNSVCASFWNTCHPGEEIPFEDHSNVEENEDAQDKKLRRRLGGDDCSNVDAIKNCEGNDSEECINLRKACTVNCDEKKKMCVDPWDTSANCSNYWNQCFCKNDTIKTVCSDYGEMGDDCIKYRIACDVDKSDCLSSSLSKTCADIDNMTNECKNYRKQCTVDCDDEILLNSCKESNYSSGKCPWVMKKCDIVIDPSDPSTPVTGSCPKCFMQNSGLKTLFIIIMVIAVCTLFHFIYTTGKYFKGRKRNFDVLDIENDDDDDDDNEDEDELGGAVMVSGAGGASDGSDVEIGEYKEIEFTDDEIDRKKKLVRL